MVTDKGERFAGQVEPLGQDLVAVVRDTRVLTGNRLLSYDRKKKKTEKRKLMDPVEFLDTNERVLFFLFFSASELD